MNRFLPDRFLLHALLRRLCQGHQKNQDGVVSRGMLRALCAYLQAPLGVAGAPGAPGEVAREAILRIK
jgi:hypothetical protein